MVILRLCLLATMLIAPAALAADEKTTKLRPSVVVTTVASRDIAQQRVYVGRVSAVTTVNLVARVEGTLEARKFREGSFVKKGDLLFIIEQTAYKAAVTQSEADLAGMQATLKNAELDYERDKGLAKTKDITATELDSSRASRDVAKANVKKAEAALVTAKLNLSYTEIHSPIDGRISATSVDVGNLVGPSSGTLATVVSLDPVYVVFYVGERDLIAARRAGLVRGAQVAVTPYLELSDGSKYPDPGKLDYVGTEIGQSTDTLEVRASFPNAGHVLVPGQFVRVTLKTDKTRMALLVPQIALQRDQAGSYVLVVGKDGKVAKREIKLSDQIGQDWVVSDGLTEGDRVIIQGIQKVYPGLVVNAVQQRG